MCLCGLQMSCCDDLEVWDAEIPANFDVWQILNTETVNVPEKDHIVFEEEMVIDKEINKEPANWVDQVEMIGETGELMNWVDQVEKLWEAGELVVTSEWKPGDKEFKSSGCPHPKCIVNGAGQARKGLNHVMSSLHTCHGLLIHATHAGSVTSQYVNKAGLIVMSSRMKIVSVVNSGIYTSKNGLGW